MSDRPHNNPFPGLRPFRDDEDYLFFGREDQTLELVSLLRQHRFLAVVGTSGSGKSSLVRAGLLPALHGGTMAQAGSSWEVVVMKPGGDPVANLAQAFLDADLYDPEDPESRLRLEATLNRSRQGLVEAVRQSDVDPDANVLVVVDQFEELFRFRQRGLSAQEAAGAFVKLLLQASDQSDLPVYVAITMRSDYLGDCAQVPGLAEAVNDGEYLIPRLRRQQRRDAVEKPVHVGGARIAERLVQRLLNDVGDDADQLPVLQHALMRTWDVWATDHADDEPIDLRHYEAAGGMEQALSLHADSVYDALAGDAERHTAEKLFKALTERTSDNREIRRPQKLGTLAAITGSEPSTVQAVIDAYRQPGVTFLMPTSEVGLTPETVVDISHESLMRVWTRLRTWVSEESQSARVYHRLLDTARLWENGQAGLYHDPDLGIATAWRGETAPTPAWAELYGGGFDTASRFLDASRTEADRQEREKEESRQRELAQAKALAESQARTAALLKRFAVTVAVALVAAIALSVYAFKLKGIADTQSEIASVKAEEAEEAKTKAHLAQGKTSLAIARAASEAHRDLSSRLLAARAIGFSGFGATDQPALFADEFPVLIPSDNPEWAAATRIARSGDPTVPAWVYPNVRHHPGEISTLATHPDRVLAATCGEATQSVYVWNLETGRVIAYLEGHSRDVEALAFSHDGTLLASAADQGDNAVIFWDTSTWTEKFRVELRSDEFEVAGIHAMAFSPDDRFVAAGDEDGVLFRIDVGKQAFAHYPGLHSSRIFDLAFAPDGQTLATCSQDGLLSLLDAETLEKRHAIEVTPGNRVRLIASLAFAPDSSWIVATARFNTPEIWDVTTDPPTRLSFLLRDVTDQNPDFEFRADAVAVSGDGQRIAVAWNDEEWNDSYADISARPTVSVFDSSDPRNPVHLHDHWGHPQFIRALEFVPGTRRYFAGDDAGVLTHRDADTPPDELSAIPGHPGNLRTAAVSPDGRWFVTSDTAANTFLWDAAGGTMATRLVGAGDFATAATFAPDSKKLYTANFRDRAVYVWDVPSGELLQKVTVDYKIDDLDISPDASSLVVVGDARQIDFFALAGDGMLGNQTTLPTNHWTSAVAFLPDGRLILVGGKLIELMKVDEEGDWVSAEMVADIHDNNTSAVTVHPDGTRVAISTWGADGGVSFWDVAPDDTITQDESLVLRDMDAHITDVSYSPDGSALLVCTNAGLFVSDAVTGDVMTVLDEPSRPRIARFTPDSRYIFSANQDGSLRLWDRGGSDVIQKWGGLTGNPTSSSNQMIAGPWGVAFFDSGKKLAIAGGFTDAPTAIRVWDLEEGVFTRTFTAPDGASVKQITLAPGTTIAAVTTTEGTQNAQGGVVLLDLSAPDGTPPKLLFQGFGAVAAAFHPDGRTLVTSHTDGQVRLFDVPASLDDVTPVEGTVITEAIAFSPFRGLAFTPDGTTFLLSNRTGHLVFPFDRATRSLGAPARIEEEFGFSIDVAADGSYFASVSPATSELRFWNARSLAPLAAPYSLPFSAARVHCSPTGYLVAVTGNNAGLAVIDASDTSAPHMVADFNFPEGSGYFFNREVAFGTGNRSIAVSQEDGSVSLLSLAKDGSANDLARYLSLLTFDDGGNVIWRENYTPSLGSVTPTFPPAQATSPYLGFLASTPPADQPSALFEHYLGIANLAAADHALRAFPEGAPPSTDDWRSLAHLLSAELRASLTGGDSNALSQPALAALAARVAAHTDLPPDLHLTFLTNAHDWDGAQAFLVNALPTLDAEAQQDLLDQFFAAVALAAGPTALPLPTPSTDAPAPPAVPLHLGLAAAARFAAVQTLERWESDSALRLIPDTQDPTLFSQFVLDHHLASASPIVPRGATWKHFDRDEAPPAGWTEPAFDDAAWGTGPADLGFGSNEEDFAVIRTEIEKFPARVAYYFRHSFELGALPETDTLTLFLQCDDAAAIYVNGTIVHRTNLPGGQITDSTEAVQTVGRANEFSFFTHSIPAGALVVGQNTIAVSVHQTSATSSDIHLDLAITAAPHIAGDAAVAASEFIAALDGSGTGAPWTATAVAALDPQAAAGDLTASIARSRIQALSLNPAAELATLESIAYDLRDSRDPADWRRYRDTLLRRETILEGFGRDMAAGLTRIAVANHPPRPDDLPDTQLDLTGHYNSSIYDGRAWIPHANYNVTNLAAVPDTVQPSDGIAFDARGIIQIDSGVFQSDTSTGGMLIGKSISTLADRDFPLRVEGIPVGRTAKALHLLGASIHSRVDLGTEIGQVVLNYADGTTHAFPLRDHQNIPSLWDPDIPDYQPKIAWRGTGHTRGGTSDFLLGHIVCTNPHPDKEIASFDLVSAETQAGFFVVAATIEP